MSRPVHWQGCTGNCTFEGDGTSAEVCRARGWPVGTVLEGDEGYGVTRIRITAIGEEDILAVSQDVDGAWGHEHTWVFYCRCWRVVS